MLSGVLCRPVSCIYKQPPSFIFTSTLYINSILSRCQFVTTMMIAGQSWWDCFPGKSLQGCASVPENELSSWEVVGQTNHSTPIGGKWANKIPLFAAFTVRVCHFLWVHLVPISPLARVASCSKQNINFLLLHKHTHTRYLRWGLDKSRQIPSGNFPHILFLYY